MRDYRRIFERALVLTLALPAAACGGPISGEPYDAGLFDPSPPDGGPGGSSCDFTAAPPGAETTNCNWYFGFTGDAEACTGFANDEPSPGQCLTVCGRNGEGNAPTGCGLSTLPAGQIVFCYVADEGSCRPIGNGGRRPAYFASLGFGAAPAGREIGTHFARVACMEAGSIEAFRILRDELRDHGAPKRLVHGAARSMRDEMRHVRQTSALARRFGAEPVAPVPTPRRAPRGLEALALENAIEGCVRETYSALECLWQAHVANDPVVRSVMKRIARDEMKHLALSWEVHRWATSRLDCAARARVCHAQRAEIAVLTRELGRDPAAPLVDTAGLPRAPQSRALIASIAAELDRETPPRLTPSLSTRRARARRASRASP